MNNAIFKSFALTAGTALALRLAHRYSDDLNLWTAEASFMYGGEVRINVEHEIKKTVKCEHRINDPLRSVFTINKDFKIDFILDQTPFIAPMDEQEGIRMFSLQDIAALKIDAVAGYKPRHDKKDFFDIYTLLVKDIFSLKEMFSFFEQREGKNNFLDVLKNFLYNMELADQSKNPKLINNETFDWLTIKTALKTQIRHCINTF
jgi:hypothetical protein